MPREIVGIPIYMSRGRLSDSSHKSLQMDPFSWKGTPKEEEEQEATASRQNTSPILRHDAPASAAITNSTITGNNSGNTAAMKAGGHQEKSGNEFPKYQHYQHETAHAHHQQHRDDIWTTNSNEMSQQLMPSPSLPSAAATGIPLINHTNHPSNISDTPPMPLRAVLPANSSAHPNNHHYLQHPPPLTQRPRGGGGDRNSEHYKHHPEQASDAPFGATSIPENMHNQQAQQQQQWYSQQEQQHSQQQQQQQHSLPPSYYYNGNSRPQPEPNAIAANQCGAPLPDLAPPAGPGTVQEYYEQQDPQYCGNNYNVTPTAPSNFDNKNSAMNSMPPAGQHASSSPWYSWPQNQHDNLHPGEHGANQHPQHQQPPNSMYPPFAGAPPSFQDQVQHPQFYNRPPYANAWGFRNEQQQIYQNNFMPPQQMMRRPSAPTPGFHDGGNFLNLNQQSGMGLLCPYGVVNSGESDDDKQRSKKGKRKFAKVADNEPRRPLSAYNFFFSEEKEVVIALLPDIGINTKTATGSASNEEIPSSEIKDDDGDAKKDLISVKDMTVEEIQDFLVEAKDKLSPESLAEIREKVEEKTEIKLQAHLEGEKEKKSHKKSHGKISFQKLASIIGKRWRNLSDTGRKRYYDLAKQDQERFKLQERQLEKGGEFNRN